MTRFLGAAMALLLVLVGLAVWVFRFTEDGRRSWQKWVRGRMGARIERLRPMCEVAIEDDERWVTQEPLHSNFVVVCVLREGVAANCLDHLKTYRSADPDALVEVTLLETDRQGTRGCEARYDRGRYDEKLAK